MSVTQWWLFGVGCFIGISFIAAMIASPIEAVYRKREREKLILMRGISGSGIDKF